MKVKSDLMKVKPDLMKVKPDLMNVNLYLKHFVCIILSKLSVFL